MLLEIEVKGREEGRSEEAAIFSHKMRTRFILTFVPHPSSWARKGSIKYFLNCWEEGAAGLSKEK